jgi:hypothetical protein
MSNVFLSHRKADAELAERLAKQLRDSGHEIWFDEWRIEVGDSIVRKINEGLKGAAYLVVCYSASGINSPWMGQEWMASLARQLDGVGGKLLPARLSGDGPPPAILADIKYADLVKDWERGVCDLLRAIR